MTNTNEQFTSEFIPKSNWMKFEKIGDEIKGTLIDIFDKKGTEDFPDQKVYVLENAIINGIQMQGTINVGFNIKKTFVIDKMKQAKLGQRVGFKFEKEVPVKGKNPAKSISPFIWGMDENYKAGEVFDNYPNF